MLIDIHTHQPTNSGTNVAILSVIGYQFDFSADTNQPYSIGVHPWHTDNYPKQLKNIEQHISHKNCIAIGECGLDKACQTDFEVQIRVFEYQIQQSEISQKPIIIHCVRSFNEVLSLHKKRKVTQPWILHGFTANEPITRQCIDAGMYFSFGEHLIHNQQNAINALNAIPKHRLFLETDNAHFNINQIYTKVSDILHLSVTELTEIIRTNFNTCFPAARKY